jgi:hypothetical protein
MCKGLATSLRVAVMGYVCAAGCAPAAGGDDPSGGDPDGTGGEGEGEGEDPGEHDPIPDPGLEDPEECSALSVDAAPAAAPADIIWVIDNSGSMDEEEDRVQDNLNAFSQAISDSGIDHHVIMVTNASHVQVPPPLGGSDRYLAIDRDIDSNDALEKLLATFPEWRDFLRPGSVKHFIVVTDDESDMDGDAFEAAVAALPELAGGFVFHAIVAESPPWNWNSPCFTLAAAVGQIYIELQEEHGGVFYSLCQDDWAPVFDALSANVVGNATLPCAFEIPAPPDGVELDWNAVNFVYTAEGGDEDTIPNVGDDGACGDGGGWYYDDPAAPRAIHVCPATCETLEAGAGHVDVAFGCATLLE